MTRTRRTQAVGLVYSLLALSVILGCADFKAKLKPTGDRLNASIRSAVDPLEEVFSGDSKKTKKKTPAGGKADPKADPKASSPEPTSTQAQTASAQPPKPADLFFDPPSGWSVVKFVPESMRYQLKHDLEEHASLVITHHQLDAKATEAKRQEQLRQMHEQLIGRLPEQYKKQEYREWVHDDHPHILSRLKGKKGDDGPEMIVEGYSVAIADEGFIVFAAYPSARKLGSDIQGVVESLRPLPAQQPEPSAEPSQEPEKVEEDTIQGKPPARP